MKKIMNSLFFVVLLCFGFGNVKTFALDNTHDYMEIPKVEKATSNITIKQKEQQLDWGIKYMNIPLFWNLGITGKNKNIAVIDDDIDQEHEDLKQNIKKVYDCRNDDTCKDVTGDFRYLHSHGTFVTGVLGAVDNNVGVKGVAFNSNIYFYKHSYKNLDSVKTALEDVLNKVSNESKEDDIDVVNLSLHYLKGFEKTELKKEIQQLVIKLEEKNVLIVTAAGNIEEKEKDLEGNTIFNKNDPSIDQILFPAKYDEVISVGNINEKGKRFISNDESTWSATGPSLSVVAPGTDILSTFPFDMDGDSEEHNGDGVQDGYTTKTGTSFSSPYVAGLMALYKEMFPQYSNKELKDILYKNTKKVDYGYVKDGKNYEYGNGIAQANVTEKQLYKGIADESEGVVTSNRKEVKGENLFDNLTIETVLQPNDEVKYSFNEIAWDDISHFFLQMQMLKGINTPFEKTLIKSKEITDFLEKQNITLTFYDSNDAVIGKEKLIETGWNTFSKPYSNVGSFSIKNEGTEEVLLAEFELHGKNFHPVKKVRTINQTIFFNEGEKKLYDDIKNEGLAYHSFNNLTGTIIQTTKAVGWNKDKYRFDWYQISIPEKGIENLWYKPNDKEINPTHAEGIFDTTEGKIVQSKIGLYSYIYNFNNNIVDYNTTNFERDSNHYFEYRLKQPVNIDMFFLSIYNKVNLENKTFEFQFLKDNKELVGTYQVKKEDNVKQIIDLPKRYENVSRIIVKNTGNETIELSELEFFDSKDTNAKLIDSNAILNATSTYVSYRKTPNDYVDYSVTKRNEETTLQTHKGYMWDSNTQQYRWYLASNENLGLKNVWVGNSTSKKEPFQNGITDKVKGSMIATTGWASWTDRLLDNYIGPGVSMYGKSSMEYQFSEPVSIKNAFINFEFGYATIPPQLDFTVELLDENRNVILTHAITEDDAFYGTFKLTDSPITAKGFRLTNHKSDAYPNEFELFE